MNTVKNFADVSKLKTMSAEQRPAISNAHQSSQDKIRLNWNRKRNQQKQDSEQGWPDLMQLSYTRALWITGKPLHE